MFNVKGVAIGKFDKNGVEVCEGNVLRVVRRLHYSNGPAIEYVDGKGYDDYVVAWNDELAGFDPFCQLDYDGDNFASNGDGTFEILTTD